ncbi:metal-dependent hydrolase [Candidatus Woesearchaeota archaeon]|nr:metal-dependent hydrolase [Candidatus Woesearchaeota archaeon]
MIWPTHVLASIVLYVLLFKLGLFDSSLFLVVLSFMAAILGSLLPDIDERNSFLGKKSFIVARILGHRQITHSVFILIFLLFSLLFVSGGLRLLLLGFLVGYASHIFLDALTVTGIPFLGTRIHGWIKTSSIGELMIFLVLLVILILLL